MASTLVEHIDLGCAEKQLQIVQYGKIKKNSVDPYTKYICLPQWFLCAFRLEEPQTHERSL